MPSESDFSEPRLSLKLPVRIWGMDASGRPFTQEAVTETISPGEACIAGLSATVKLHDVLGLACGGRKGRFRVVATGSAASLGQVVLRALDASVNIWGVDFSTPDEAGRPERRTVTRYFCKGAITIWQQSSPHPLHLGVSDLSLQGCYVDIMYALPIGTKISLALKVSGLMIRATGKVCTSHPAVGMGVSFDTVNDADRANLEEIVAELAAASNVPPEPEQSDSPT